MKKNWRRDLQNDTYFVSDSMRQSNHSSSDQLDRMLIRMINYIPIVSLGLSDSSMFNYISS